MGSWAKASGPEEGKEQEAQAQDLPPGTLGWAAHLSGSPRDPKGHPSAHSPALLPGRPTPLPKLGGHGRFGSAAEKPPGARPA